MKHVRKDGTFIYYYEVQWDGHYTGIRVGRLGAHLIEGEPTATPNPEKMAVRGRLHVIPVSAEVAPDLFAVKEQLSNSELDALLAGGITFQAALTSKVVGNARL